MQTRREFLASPALAAAEPRKRRYAVVGTGMRGGYHLWGRLANRDYGDVLRFVGLCDINPSRVEAARQWIGADCPTFTNFDEMCDKTKPDLVMVTTPDRFHSEYIVNALNRGIDTMTEKPMVIDEKQCAAVLDAEKRSGKRLIVTFNYRYSPKHQAIKETLLSGEIGKVRSVDFSWYLNNDHGGSYFRRWHRLRSMSGSLFVHKATHHFDLINWWLDADPVEVMAQGQVQVYGKAGPFRSTHCRACPHTSQCAYFYDITKNREMQQVYVAHEGHDGYHRDGCVFRADVDSYDSMTALVRYSNGVLMNYSLHAYLPMEGYRLAFNGDRGRLEVTTLQEGPWQEHEAGGIYLTKLLPSATVQKRQHPEGSHRKIVPPPGVGAHGGGDKVLCDVIFRGLQLPAHMALPGSRAGAMSCLTGIAARKSVEERRPIRIPELVKL